MNPLHTAPASGIRTVLLVQVLLAGSAAFVSGCANPIKIPESEGRASSSHNTVPASAGRTPGTAAMLDEPTVSQGSIVTNSEIWCTCHNKNDFYSSHRGQTFPIPYDGGPNMMYGEGDDQTGAWAYTKATASLPVASTTAIEREFTIENTIGGQSGSHGKGGHGRVEPKFSSEVTLTRGSNWNVKLTASASADGVANDPSVGDLKAWKMRISRIVEPGKPAWSQEVDVPRNGKLTRLPATNLEPGRYSVTLECPPTVRGSYGGRLGQRDQGKSSINVLIEAARTSTP